MSDWRVANSVLLAIPFIGLQAVRGSYVANGATNYSSVYTPRQGGSFGVHASTVTVTGQQVLIAEGNVEGLRYATVHGAYLIGQVKETHPISKLRLGGYTQDICLSVDRSTFASYLYQTFFSKQAQPIKLSGQLLTSWQGDYTIRDKDGCAGLFKGRYITVLSQSPMCQLTMAKFNNSISTLSQELQLLTTTSLDYSTTELKVSAWTAYPEEALGHVHNSNSPVFQRLSQQTSACLTDTKVIGCTPCYRQYSLSSRLLNGCYHITCAPDSSTTAPWLEAGNQTSIKLLQVTKEALNGQITTCSATVYRCIKTPNLHGFLFTEVQDLTVTSQYRQIKSELTELQQVDNKALLIEQQLTPDAQLAAAYADLWKANKIAALDTEFITEQLHKQTLAARRSSVQAKKGSFQLPKKVSIPVFLQDKDTPVEQPIYDSTSFITQQPDGSILIKDGYGSELRMTRGNIIISSALDTYIRPGRNLISLVPGSAVTTGNKVCMTARKSAYYGSGGDFSIISSLSKQGTLQLNSVQGSLALAARTQIKSISDNILFGGNTLNGAFIVNMEQGPVAISGGDTSLQGSSLMLAALTSNKYSYMQISNNTIIQRCSSHVSSGSLQLKALTGKVNDEYDCYSSNEPSLKVTSLITKTINCYGSIAAQGAVQAAAMGTTSGIIGKINQTPLLGKRFEQQLAAKKDYYTYITHISVTSEETESQLTQLPDTAWYGLNTASFTIHAMAWQTEATDKLQPLTYNNSYEFPGAALWVASIFQTVSSVNNIITVKKNQLTEYTINLPKEN